MPTIVPPNRFIQHISDHLADLLSTNPASTSSEAYVQNHLEFAMLNDGYTLRAGINYHGGKVQELRLVNGTLHGWNPQGNALGTASRAKMLLSGYTIVDRDSNEHDMSDSKFSGGTIPQGNYLRVEFKCRGWLGKTKNLDGKQLLKDIDLLKDAKADLLVILLSETAHKKWRGEGDAHHAQRRTGTDIFSQILIPIRTSTLTRNINLNGQNWTIYCRKVIGSRGSIMPEAEHYINMCWRT